MRSGAVGPADGPRYVARALSPAINAPVRLRSYSFKACLGIAAEFLGLFGCRHRSYFDGIAVQRAGHLCLLAGKLVQSIEVLLVCRVQGINLVTDHKRVLGTFGNTGPSALRRSTTHVMGAAHGITDLSGVALRLVGG